jgi:hypothetical protein
MLLNVNHLLVPILSGYYLQPEIAFNSASGQNH